MPAVKEPIISPKAKLTSLEIPSTLVCDFDTEPGKTYVLTACTVG